MNNYQLVWNIDEIVKHPDPGIQKVMDAFTEIHHDLKCQKVPIATLSINSKSVAGGAVCDLQFPYEKRGELLAMVAEIVTPRKDCQELSLRIITGDPDNDQTTGQVLYNKSYSMDDIRGGLIGKYDIVETCWTALSEHLPLKPPMV